VLSISQIKPTPLLLWDPGHLFRVVVTVVMSDLFYAILFFLNSSYPLLILLQAVQAPELITGLSSSRRSRPRAATDRGSTARLECGLTSSAAGGASVPRKFAPGELQKKRRHIDVQECMDELVGGMETRLASWPMQSSQSRGLALNPRGGRSSAS